MYTRQIISTLYRESYAEVYEKLYLEPWPEKHQINLKLLQLILSGLPRSSMDLSFVSLWDVLPLMRRSSV
jgi:hypothetical protein